jgi:hypothetical protein
MDWLRQLGESIRFRDQAHTILEAPAQMECEVLKQKIESLSFLKRVLLRSMPGSNHKPASNRWRRINGALLLSLASLVVFAFAAYPFYVIRPFREQKPAALNRALWVVLNGRPILVGLFCLIAISAYLLWRRSGSAARAVLVPAVVIALLATASSWVNPDEILFHPFGSPRYVSAQQASVDPSDMVIAVTLGAESRAYPIREMGYHHIINDRLHQLPFVVTY